MPSQINESIWLHRVFPHLCGMARRIVAKRRLMIFRAFFDESGTDPKLSDSLIMGGFLGHFEEWEKAVAAWDKALLEDPKINYFSHREANGCSGQFRSFTPKQAQEKKLKLANVLAAFKLQGFCVAVEHCWFHDRHPKAAKGMMGSRVYDWGFIGATSGVLQYMERLELPEYKVDFIFDERNELRACRAIFDEMKAAKMPHIAHGGSCASGNDKELAALQMADMLAGEYADIRPTGTSEAWAVIAGKQPVVFIPMTPPPLIPNTLALHKMAAEIRDKSYALMRRFYRDKERSIELDQEVANLRNEEAYFLIEMKHLQDAMGSDWLEYKQNLDSDEEVS